jgi:hypothetical protein
VANNFLPPLILQRKVAITCHVERRSSRPSVLRGRIARPGHPKSTYVCIHGRAGETEAKHLQDGVETLRTQRLYGKSSCIHFLKLPGKPGLDWGVCANPVSPRVGLLTFEHQGCEQFESREYTLPLVSSVEFLCYLLYVILSIGVYRFPAG